MSHRLSQRSCRGSFFLPMRDRGFLSSSLQGKQCCTNVAGIKTHYVFSFSSTDALFENIFDAEKR